MQLVRNYVLQVILKLKKYHVLYLDAEYPTLDQKIQAIQGVIECLPIAHQYLLLYLLDLLGMFATAQEYTRMDTACLASVFAPVGLQSVVRFHFDINVAYRVSYLIPMTN